MELKFKLNTKSIREVEKNAKKVLGRAKILPAMAEAAEMTILPEAQRLCPVDSGALRDSIESFKDYQGSTRNRHRLVIRHNKLVRRWWAGELRIPTRYSFYVEKGKGAHAGKNKAYMRPALDTEKRNFVKALAFVIRGQLTLR